MKSLEHTIRDILEKKSNDVSNMEIKLINFIKENSHSGKTREELLEEIANLQEKGPKETFVNALKDVAKKISDKAPKEKLSAEKPIAKPEAKSDVKTSKTDTPAETKPSALPSETKPDNLPAVTKQEPKTSTELKRKVEPESTPKTSSSGGKLGAVGTAIAAVAGYKWLRRALGDLLNPGSGGQTPGISTYGNQGQLHQANAPTRIESVERTAVEYVGRPKPKLKKLRKALGKEYPIGKQGSVKTKIIDEATEKFIEKAKKAKEKDHSKVTETETVAKAKYNHESPDGKYY